MKKIDILQRNNDIAGLCSFIWTFFDLICNSIVRRNSIPVIDMMHLDNFQFHTNETKNNINVWEDYFEQPCGISLNDIQNDDNITTLQQKNFLILNQIPLNEQRVLAKKFLRVKQNINDIAKQFFSLNCDKNTLGVLIRGTDYVNLKPTGHPSQPSIDTVIADCKDIIKKQNISNIFLMTESNDIANTMKNEFPGLIIQYQNVLLKNLNCLICNYLKDKTYEFKKSLNTQYLISLLILCMCNNTLLSNTSAMEVYRFMRETDPKFEKIYRLSYYF